MAKAKKGTSVKSKKKPQSTKAARAVAIPKKGAAKSKKKNASSSWTMAVSDSLDAIVKRVEGLFSKEPKDIATAIKKDHEGLRNFIDVLKDGHRDIAERRRAYHLFSTLLKSHTLAEENAVYVPVEKLPKKDLKIEIAEGFVEHQVADDLMEKMSTITDAKTWAAHANVLAELVDHHLKEEEDELLPLIRQSASKELDQAMLAQYMELRQETQEIVKDENAGVLGTLTQ